MAHSIQNIYDSMDLFIHELRNVVQSGYNMLSKGRCIEEDILISQKLWDKLRSIEIISKEDIDFISKNTEGLYFAYTKDSKRKMMMRTPDLQRAWKKVFTTN